MTEYYHWILVSFVFDEVWLRYWISCICFELHAPKGRGVMFLNLKEKKKKATVIMSSVIICTLNQCSSKSMQFHELGCSYIKFHVSLSEQLTKTSQCLSGPIVCNLCNLILSFLRVYLKPNQLSNYKYQQHLLVFLIIITDGLVLFYQLLLSVYKKPAKRRN